MDKVLIVIVVLLIFAVVGIISISNSLNVAVVKVDEANSGIDVALTKRYFAKTA